MDAASQTTERERASADRASRDLLAPSRDQERLRGNRGTLLVLGVRLQYDFAHLLLRGGIAGDRPQQCEAAPLAVHGVLTGRKRDVPAASGAALPDGKADQLQAGQYPF